MANSAIWFSLSQTAFGGSPKLVPLVVVGLNSELFRGFFQVQLVGLGDNLKGLDEVDDDVSPQDAACPKKTQASRQPDFQYEAAEGAE